jgi:hypothetical protein
MGRRGKVRQPDAPDASVYHDAMHCPSEEEPQSLWESRLCATPLFVSPCRVRTADPRMPRGGMGAMRSASMLTERKDG